MPETIAEVIAALRAIDAELPDTDGIKWFNRLYLQMTEAVSSRLSAAGFENPIWMERLDVKFGACYFSAAEAWRQGGPLPGCWRALFSRRYDPRIARVQFALAGVNAHINHDLPMALVETLEATGTQPQTAEVQYGDYSGLNATLEAVVDAARRELNVRLCGDELPEASHLQETLASWNLTAAREAAWTNAELIWDVRDIPLISGRYLDVIDGLATVAGKSLLVAVP